MISRVVSFDFHHHRRHQTSINFIYTSNNFFRILKGDKELKKKIHKHKCL